MPRQAAKTEVTLRWVEPGLAIRACRGRKRLPSGADIPVDNIVQDWFRWTRKGEHVFNNNYPDPKGMIDDLHRNNFHLTISVWPFFERPLDASLAFLQSLEDMLMLRYFPMVEFQKEHSLALQVIGAPECATESLAHSVSQGCGQALDESHRFRQRAIGFLGLCQARRLGLLSWNSRGVGEPDGIIVALRRHRTSESAEPNNELTPSPRLVPPPRGRVEDMPLLTRSFVEEFARRSDVCLTA